MSTIRTPLPILAALATDTPLGLRLCGRCHRGYVPTAAVLERLVPVTVPEQPKALRLVRIKANGLRRKIVADQHRVFCADCLPALLPGVVRPARAENRA